MTRTSIIIEEEKKDRLIELGFNISAVCRAAIDQALDVTNDDLIFDMRIRRIEEEIITQSSKLEDLTIASDYCRSRLKYLKEERERLKADSIKAIEVAKYSAVVTKMNRIIIAANYDRIAIDMALATDTGKTILEEMMGVNPSFDLTRQISNVKSIMDS
jgi:hypothetical protein